jgi:hypothetical protein
MKSITAAIREAKTRHQLISHGDQWVVTSLRDNGCWSHSQPTTYQQAVEKRCIYRAEEVLCLLGVWNWDAQSAIHDNTGDLMQRIKAGLYHAA